MHTFRVLDPACGSGNFLYIAYREMKRLEARIYERIDTEFPKFATPDQIRFSYLSAQNSTDSTSCPSPSRSPRSR